MFKIAKLQNVNNEKVNINTCGITEIKFENGKKAYSNDYKALSFQVNGDNYSFEFTLNCKLEELLKIPEDTPIDFKDYMTSSELTVQEELYFPQIDATATRYLKTKFSIFVAFYIDHCFDVDDIYSGMIEFSFNLADYLED